MSIEKRLANAERAILMLLKESRLDNDGFGYFEALTMTGSQAVHSPVFERNEEPETSEPPSQIDYLRTRPIEEALTVITQQNAQHVYQQKEIDKLKMVIARLGSSEAFTNACSLHPRSDAELMARIDYARKALEG